ncbi:YdbL family protein [Allohahella marinimesophila]|uniref:YdbL family protein n=1 Tax=Allohahella marinimesophila TaxID=1054972 RepID=A0ABP7PDC6_9GAMM
MIVARLLNRFRSLAVLPFIAMLSLQAWALDLESAKAQGLVGEQPNGYLAAVVTSPEAEALVQEINAKREDAYVRVAEKNKIEVSKVGALAGKKLIEKSEPGHFVRLPNGQWQKL